MVCMVRHRIHVDGMTCRGCEAVIRREIDTVADVTDVTADHERGLVAFTAEHETVGSYVEQVVDDLGYEVTAYESLEAER